MFGRRERPDYEHIADLEAELGVVKTELPPDPAPQPPKHEWLEDKQPKRDMVPVSREFALTTLSASLDHKTGGLILEPLRPRLNTICASSYSYDVRPNLAQRGILGSSEARRVILPSG